MNEVAKALRWIVNQIPEFKPKTSEEKLIQTIRSYCSAGANEIDRLEGLLPSKKSGTVSLVGIDVYTNYKIEHTCTYTYESDCYDGHLPNKTEQEEFTMNGGEFAEKVLSKLFQQKDFSGIYFEQNQIITSSFDPLTGHYSNDIYKLEEIKENERH